MDVLTVGVLAPVARTFGGKFSRAFHVVFSCFGTGCRNFWWEVFPRISCWMSSVVLVPAAATIGGKFSRAFRVGAMNIYFKSHRPSREIILSKNRVTGFIFFSLKKTVRVSHRSNNLAKRSFKLFPRVKIRITGVLHGLALGPRDGKSLRVSWPLYIPFKLGYIELCN